MWDIENGSYRSVYLSSIRKAAVALPGELYQSISIPEAVAVTSEYRSADLKILILGQETFENSTPLVGSSDWQAWAQAIGGYVSFDFAYGGEGQETRKFWKAFDLVQQKIGCQSRRSIAWSNASKCQLVDRSPGERVSIAQRLGAERKDFATWQSPLFRAELEFIRPDAVLAMVGLNNWFEHLLYAAFDFDGGAAVNHHEFDDRGYRVWSGLPFRMVSTFHPNGWNARIPPEEALQNALDALLSTK